VSTGDLIIQLLFSFVSSSESLVAHIIRLVRIKLAEDWALELQMSQKKLIMYIVFLVVVSAGESFVH
jgi:hypothetical protein